MHSLSSVGPEAIKDDQGAIPPVGLQQISSLVPQNISPASVDAAGKSVAGNTTRRRATAAERPSPQISKRVSEKCPPHSPDNAVNGSWESESGSARTFQRSFISLDGLESLTDDQGPKPDDNMKYFSGNSSGNVARQGKPKASQVTDRLETLTDDKGSKPDNNFKRKSGSPKSSAKASMATNQLEHDPEQQAKNIQIAESIDVPTPDEATFKESSKKLMLILLSLIFVTVSAVTGIMLSRGGSRSADAVSNPSPILSPTIENADGDEEIPSPGLLRPSSSPASFLTTEPTEASNDATAMVLPIEPTLLAPTLKPTELESCTELTSTQEICFVYQCLDVGCPCQITLKMLNYVVGTCDQCSVCNLDDDFRVEYNCEDFPLGERSCNTDSRSIMPASNQILAPISHFPAASPEPSLPMPSLPSISMLNPQVSISPTAVHSCRSLGGTDIDLCFLYSCLDFECDCQLTLSRFGEVFRRCTECVVCSSNLDLEYNCIESLGIEQSCETESESFMPSPNQLPTPISYIPSASPMQAKTSDSTMQPFPSSSSSPTFYRACAEFSDSADLCISFQCVTPGCRCRLTFEVSGEVIGTCDECAVCNPDDDAQYQYTCGESFVASVSRSCNADSGSTMPSSNNVSGSTTTFPKSSPVPMISPGRTLSPASPSSNLSRFQRSMSPTASIIYSCHEIRTSIELCIAAQCLDVGCGCQLALKVFGNVIGTCNECIVCNQYDDMAFEHNCEEIFGTDGGCNAESGSTVPSSS